MADFDMTVAGASVAGRYIDASHYEVCACQGGTPGAMATVTASYPARSLTGKARVPGVSIQREAPFTIAPAKGAVNPLACTTPAAALPRIAPLPIPAATIAPASPAAPGNPVAGLRDPSICPVDPVAGLRDPSIRPIDPLGGTPLGTAVPPQVPRSVGATAPSTLGGIGIGTALPSGASAQGRVGLINPSGLTAVQTGPGKITLSWQPVAGVAAYGITGPGTMPQAPFPYSAVVRQGDGAIAFAISHLLSP